MPLAMTARVLSLALGCLLATPVGAGAQAFFTATPSPDLRIAPLTIRAAVTPAEGPVPMRVQFGVMAPAGATVPDLYLLWPGEVKGDPSLGAPQPDLAEQVTALRYEVIDEVRLVLRARNLTAGGGPGAREPVPGGAPYVTFVQTGGAVGLSAPGTWIRIPSTPRLADPGWITTLEISSLSAVKAKRPTWLERLVLGERTEEETEATLDTLPEGTQQVGFYSYGEISPHTSGRCDLHNQTMTLTVLSELP